MSGATKSLPESERELSTDETDVENHDQNTFLHLEARADSTRCFWQPGLVLADGGAWMFFFFVPLTWCPSGQQPGAEQVVSNYPDRGLQQYAAKQIACSTISQVMFAVPPVMKEVDACVVTIPQVRIGEGADR